MKRANFRMRDRVVVAAAFACALLSPAIHAQPDGERVPLEITGASMVHPSGWTLMPAAGSPPVVLFHLCEAGPNDGCLVAGEMSMTAPRDEVGSAPAPLSDLLEQLKHAPHASQPRLVNSGSFKALESHWSNPEAPMRHGKAGATMQIDTPRGRFECALTMPPETLAQHIETWRRFCASLDAGSSQEGMNSNG